MRSDVLLLSGFVCVLSAAFLVSLPLGLLVVGCGCCVVGWAISGSQNKKRAGG